MQDNIIKLLNEVRGLKLNSVDLSDNIFSILEITDKEIFHCRFLRYLIKLDWKGFCNEVLDMPQFANCKNLDVTCEYPSEHLDCMQEELLNAKDGRIDILCQTERAIVAIEVKWYAGDQPQQLLRYYKRLEALFPSYDKDNRKLYYLTLSGKAASKYSVKCDIKNCKYSQNACELGNDDYKIISFDKIKKWLQKNEYYGNEIIKQYYDVLDKELNMNEVAKNIIADKDKYYAANNVADAISEAQGAIRKAFMSALKSKIEEKFATVGIVPFDGDSEEFNDFKFDKYVKENECLAFRLKNKYLLVWATNKLYWYLGDSCEFGANIAWSYINKSWFNGTAYDVDTKGNTDSVNCKLNDKENIIVELYFEYKEDKMKDSPQIENIVNNMYNHISKISNF